MSRHLRVLFLIVLLTVISGVIAMPDTWPIKVNIGQWHWEKTLTKPPLEFNVLGKTVSLSLPLKQGLDILGGMQVVLQADMNQIDQSDRLTALESAKQVIQRRVDLYGISEPVVQTSQQGDNYRIIVELAGVADAEQALTLIGTTAQLDFKLMASASAEATTSAVAFLNQFEPTGLTGKQLKRANVQFDPQTSQPIVAIEFNDEGTKLFADITQKHTGEVLAIFLDEMPLMFPRIQTPILTGQGVITGDFTVEEAKNLSIQLNAGALPVPITVLEQRSIGPSLGQESVRASITAGMIGLSLVMLFMTLYYGFKGVLASLALGVYALLTIAIYKILGVTLTLPGIAGLILSIGMAVDANILIFERMKEEIRVGQPPQRAMELGFGRAWDSIKDANLVTIATALILMNPFDFYFLNTSGLVRGFGLTLLIGVMISLFTGIVVTRTLMRVFLKR